LRISSQTNLPAGANMFRNVLVRQVYTHTERERERERERKRERERERERQF
jgi:hypothetical protein